MKLAAFVSAGHSLEQAVERANLAEKLGYDAVFDTHIAARDGLMLLAAYGAATTRIKLGTGVLPAFPRHPVSLAIEAATLDEIIGGRLILGIGPSHQVTMEGWYGISMAKPLSQMREYVDVVRQVFTRDGAQLDGEFYKVSYAFMGYGARKDLPIYVSALSPNMLRFAGGASDGVVLWGCLPNYIERVVVPNVRAGAEAAGRDPASIEIAAAIPTALTTNAEAGRDALRGDFFTYMMLPYYRRAIEGAGYGEEIAAFDAANGRGDMPGALAAMSDRMLGEFAAIGDGSVIKKKIEEYRAAGVTLPCIGTFQAGDGFAGIDATLEAAIS